MSTDFFYKLVDKYLEETATEEEKALVEAYYATLSSEETAELSSAQRTKIKNDIIHKVEEMTGEEAVPKPVTVQLLPFLKKIPVRYAAAILLIGGIGAILMLLFLQTGRKRVDLKGPVVVNDKPAPININAGTDKAVLTLADGSTILLDNSANKEIAVQGNTRILKLDDGSLAYNSRSLSGATIYNTISTPKGGQYQIRLPDGTRVWLNAASSIRFPTAFGDLRTVTVTGEAFFEIKSDRSRPFEVNTRTQTIQVIGTSFNVNAYNDEILTRTTLMDGGVIVKQGTAQVRLKPGEQAISSTALTVDRRPDLVQVTAWKNGSFDFNQTTLEAAFKQIARWYDIEVKYDTAIAQQRLGGQMGRNLTLQQVLNLFEGIDMHFELKGRVLYVSP